MYHLRSNLGALGQAPTQATQFVAGSSATLTFTLDAGGATSLASGLSSASGIQSALTSWAPFSGGAFSLESVGLDDPITPSVVTVAFTVNATGAQYNYGQISASMAQIMSGALLMGSVSPYGLGPGLGGTPTVGATVAAIAPTISLNPISSVNVSTSIAALESFFGGGSSSGGAPPTTTPSWVWLALAAGAGLVLLLAIR